MSGSMRDKVVVITGATSGIGEVAADRLAQRGARIVFVARDRHRGEETRRHLRAIAGHADHTVHYADLSRLSAMKRVAREIDVTANCFHPGFVRTRFGDAGGGLLSWGIGIAKNFALTPEQGAETMIYLVSSPEVEGKTGGYYYKCALATPSREGQNDADAKRL